MTDPSWRGGGGVGEGHEQEEGGSAILVCSPRIPLETSSTGTRAASAEATPMAMEIDETSSFIQERREPTTSYDESQGWEVSKGVSDILPYLYGSHLLSKWGDRMWEFAVGLFMIQVWPSSLLLAAVYGLAETASIAVLGGAIGNWLDRNPRLKVVQISLGVQNSSIMIAGLALVALLGLPGLSLQGGSIAFFALVVVVNVCGSLAALGGVASNLVVERDWVVVISENQAPELLAEMNSVMRRIDLSCKLLAPVLVGALMSFISPLWCAVAIASWNGLSVGFEYWFLTKVYCSITALQQNIPSTQTNSAGCGNPEVEDAILIPSHGNYRPVRADEEDVIYAKSNPSTPFWQKTIEGWRLYCQQEVVLAGVSLALLYLTVLSFGSLMTAVLHWRGVPAFVLGLARGAAALVGIIATVVYPVVHSHLKTVRTGLWSIWIQWSLLSLCATSVLVQNGIEASGMLIAGVAASRFGLWMFDLSVTQLMQETIPEHQRGVVGGVQNSLQSIMAMLSYVMAIIISKPEKFWIPVMISYGSVGLAAVLYASYVHKTRGHLLHLDRLFHKL